MCLSPNALGSAGLVVCWHRYCLVVFEFQCGFAQLPLPQERSEFPQVDRFAWCLRVGRRLVSKLTRAEGGKETPLRDVGYGLKLVNAKSVVMSNEEKEIHEFLKRYPQQFVSINDISKSVGSRKNFHEDRNWTLPVLRRMELEGWVESNAFGEFRVKVPCEDTTSFLKALETPGMSLGDTTIITLQQDAKSKAA